MNDRLLRAYHCLPYFAQSWCAAYHGARLSRLRYGLDFERALPTFATRETWSSDEWDDYQLKCLNMLLVRAFARVPYYRHLSIAENHVGELRSINELGKVPLLDKDLVRDRPTSFLADDCDPACMYSEHTSGTTGKPLQLWWSPKTHQSWYACFERRARNWAGVERGMPWGMLGGQLVVPAYRIRPPFWVWNPSAQQLYMSSYHLSPRFLDAYLDEIRRRRLEYLYGYASSLDALATHALETGRDDISLRVVISNAEPFLLHQRQRIEKAFGCATRDTYAPAELTIAAFECERGQMHISPDIGIVEVLRDDGSPAPPGEVGELVVTGLLNQDHILIRYRQGDRGALSPPEEQCPCGRRMRILRSIEGRCDDVLTTADGRKVGRMDPVFKEDLRIREAQIAQVSATQIEVRVVAANGFGTQDVNTIVRGVRERLGEMSVKVIVVKCLERTSAGKLRTVVSEMNT